MFKIAASKRFGNWNFAEFYQKATCFALIELIFWTVVGFLSTWLCLEYILFDLLDWHIESIMTAGS